MTRRFSLCAVLACLTACARSEATVVDDTPPEDEVWLSAAQMAKANIRVDAASMRALPDAVHASGRVSFDDAHVTHVFSPVTGRVAAVLAQPGDRVVAGTPLLRILSPDVGTAFADVLKARSDLRATAADYQRQTGLLAHDATSRRAYEAAEDSYHRAQAESQRVQQRAALLRAGDIDAVTQQYTLRAFLAGKVVARAVNPGAEVVGQYAGGTAVELFTIGDIHDVWIEAEIDALDLPRLAVGRALDATVLAYPGRVFHGTIDYIAGTVDPALRTTRVRATIANTDEALKPGMLATVEIAQPAVSVLAVPRDAVVQINESRYVYVATTLRDDGRQVFKRRPVTIDRDRGGMVPIVDGLVAGDRVVVEGTVSRQQPTDEVWPTPTQLRNAAISTTQIAPQAATDVVTVGGKLAFDDAQITHVFSPVNGRLIKLLAAPGQHVSKGTPLATIVSPDVGAYLADLVKADADRVQAEHELARQQELVAAHVGAPRELEAAEAALHKAQAERDRARQLTQLVDGADFDTVTQQFILRSPIAGDVIARKTNLGAEVQGQYAAGGGAGGELFTIGDAGRLWLVADVFERDLPRIATGETVRFHVAAYPGRELTGHVDWIADMLDPVTHTAKVRAVIDNASRVLKPDMYVSVDIAVRDTPQLVVPREALVRFEGQTIVFVKTGEARPDGSVVFKRRTVVANTDSVAANVPVVSGLAAGETVAVGHALMLLGMLSS